MLTSVLKKQNARRGILLLIITAFLAALGVGGFASPAFAADCVHDTSTGCVRGVIKTADGEPAAGVELSLKGGGEDQTTKTSSEGTWSFAVTEAGPYTVSVDESTLPEGQSLKAEAERTINVQLNNSASGLFALTGGDEAGEGQQAKSSFSWTRFWQQFASGIRMGLLIALAALGLSLIFGTTGLSNFAHGEMVSLGGLLGATFMTMTGNLLLAGALVVIAMAAFGWAQDKVLWKPLRKRKLSLMQMMIVSIGLSITLQFLFQFIWGAGLVRVDRRNPSTVTFLGITLTTQSLVAMGVAILAIALVGFGLMYTRFGRATRAISDNPALAQASGINVDRVINIVWVVGGALAGLAGLFLGLVFNGINWFTGGQMLLLFFAAVTLGGLGTAFGAFVGSMVIGMLVEISNIWLPGDLKFATALFVMILILLVRPQGIFGRKERIG